MSTRTIVLFILVFKKEIGQNEPKETWQFSKFAHNSAEGVIYMKQGFDPPKLGVVCDKKLSPFLDSGGKYQGWTPRPSLWGGGGSPPRPAP